MLLPSLSRAALLLAAALPFAAAERRISSSSLNPCQANSSFTATLFQVSFTPKNMSLDFTIQGVSTISGKVNAEVELLVYGYSAIKQSLNPCDHLEDLSGLCPMTSGSLDITSNFKISPDILSKIPGTSIDACLRATANRDQESPTRSPTSTPSSASALQNRTPSSRSPVSKLS
jgi:hypothetical protein